MILIKVLVCGSYKGAFQKKFLQRLKKEKQEVFVLNNDSVVERKPSAVFQDYRFSYDSNSVMNVMTSIVPDVVVFCGAMDESYNEGEKISQSVEFVSGLMNVLSCAVAVKVKRFIFISSEDIFSGSNQEVFIEETQSAPTSRWEKALLQGEQICLTSNENEQMEVSVVRLPQLYGAFQESVIAGVCANFMESFVEDTPIMINKNVTYHLLYLDDAVEAIYRVMNIDSENLKHMYHIAPAKSVSEKEIYELFVKITGHTLNVLNEKEIQIEGKCNQRFLSTTQEGLGFREKFSLEEGLNILYKQKKSIEKKIEEKVKKEEDSENKKLFMPIIETLVAFLVTEILVYLTQGAAFHSVIDIYLIFTILVAVTLGSMPATIAVVLSILGKYSMLLMNGEIIDIFTQYENYLWILQLFGLSVLTGYIRDRYNHIVAEMQNENVFLQDELKSMKQINDSNVEVKEVFENRLENYKDSYVKVFEIVSQLDDLESKSIIFNAATVVADIMKSKNVAIYTYEENTGFCRLMASTSELAKSKGKSFRLNEYEKVVECLKNKAVYMNREFNEKMPMYAVGTYSEDRLEVVTMIWDIDLAYVNLHQSNLLSMLGKLLERSMSRALRYMESIKETTYLEGTNVMEADAFYQMLDIYCAGESQGVLEYTLLVVDSTVEENPDLYTALGSVTRGTDYIGLNENEKLYVLLTNSSEKDAHGVVERFKNRGVNVFVVDKQKGKTAVEVFGKAVF